jgi:hypothetical protein
MVVYSPYGLQVCMNPTHERHAFTRRRAGGILFQNRSMIPGNSVTAPTLVCALVFGGPTRREAPKQCPDSGLSSNLSGVFQRFHSAQAKA